MSEPLVDLVVEEPGWEAALPDLGAVAETAARLAIEAAGEDPDGWQVALLACSDTRIAALNAAHRGRDKATDVLSFPAFAPPVPPSPAPRSHLGDVALALGTAEKDAAARNTALKDHATHLILHSVLHLFGFDHETDTDAAMMEKLEVQALGRIGISDPYSRGDAVLPHPDR